MRDQATIHQPESPEPMDDLTHRITGLSPAKRALLEMRLKVRSQDAHVKQTIPRRMGRDSAPLSFAQQRLWFLDQLEPNSAVYNVFKAVSLRGVLNADALKQALTTIVHRHEVLRTTFVSVDGNPAQIVAASRAVDLAVVDLSKTPAEVRVKEVERCIAEEAQRPFNLSTDPMLRASLLRLDPEEHVLLLVKHHIASDGWSTGILCRELSALYDAYIAGEPSPLPDLPIQYGDFADWQREWLQGNLLHGQLSYWKRQLEGAPSLVNLPLDRPRPALQTYRGSRRPFSLPAHLTVKLRAFSQQDGVTLFMTLLAAFQTLLYRYTRQYDIVVGSPIAGRTRTELEELIGFFVNTLVFRADLSGNPPFRELLRRVRRVCLDAYAHQDLPFEKLVAELQPHRDLSRNPLFQVWFALQNVPRNELTLKGLEVKPFNVDIGTAKFDLALTMVEQSETIRGTLEYNIDLFEDPTITRMLGHFETLLEGITAYPEQRLSDLPILTERERHQLLVEWNDTGKDYPKDKCIHQLFETHAYRTPDATAVVFPSTGSGHSEDKRLTYRELNRQANQLAHHLRALGVGPEVRVAIFVERSLEMVIGLLGILKAGGAYVPLDPTQPGERLALMLEDAQVAVLLTQSKLLEQLPKMTADGRPLTDDDARSSIAQRSMVIGPQSSIPRSAVRNPVVICLDRDWEIIARESGENPISWSETKNLAYVIYTSGSTGKPKGVMITHRAVVNFLNSMCQQPGLASEDALLSVTTLSFDIAALEIFLPLTVGARVVMVSRGVAADGVQLREILERYGVTAMQATPATWRLLLEAGWQGGRRLKMLCGGEALQGNLAADLLARGSSLWNMYGPTETTIWSSVHPVGLKDGTVPIGRPIANTEIHILDSHFQPVPIGVPGDLYIAGAGLARGYLNRPDLTAEKFIPNPFSKMPGARLYKSGDLARYLPDGNIEFLGRTDHQVKIRGFRIELGEIEAVLAQHSAIQQAVVMAPEGEPGERRLAAYVLSKQEQYPTATELRSFLRAKLPEYMVPSTFVLLDAFPLTSNGKVNRQALPAPDGTRPDLEKAFVAPRDELESQLTGIWEEILGVNPIGVKDNFFDLGGHSLLAVRLFAQINKLAGKSLPLATLFQAPTIEQLADLLRSKKWSPSWSSLVGIQPNGSKPPFFCVHAHGGNVLNFNNLARHLGSDQPFYGLQAQGLDGTRPAHTSIEEMATHYIQELRAIQPEGPYFIGGYCFGGTVAFEMAHQLRSQSQEVALLALIDSYAPGRRPRLSWPQSRWVQIRFHLRNLEKLTAGEKRKYVQDKMNIIGGRMGRRVKQFRAKVYRFCQTSRGSVPAEFLKTKRRSRRPYSLKVYAGKITVFSPTESHSAYYLLEPHMGWNGLGAEGLDIRRIPGKVASIIFEPSVKELAEQLRNCMEATRADASKQS